MSDVAKHGSVVGHGVIPTPDPSPVLPDISDAMRIPLQLGSPTVFDGDDYNPVNTSFDIEGAAARVVTAYDRDNDGAIDLGTGGLFGALTDETSRILTGRGPASIETLAKFADENGNNDGSATVEEIANVIRKFDQGNEGDGRLSAQERETFLEVFGEERRPVFRHFEPHPLPFPLEPRPIRRHPGDILLGDHPQLREMRVDAAKLSDGDAIKGP